MTDLLLVNGDIVTMDPGLPRCHWIAAQDGKVTGLGSGRPPAGCRTQSTVAIDLKGRTALPGFIDAHLHFRALAESLVTIPLGPKTGIRSIGGIIKRIQDAAASLPPGTWIRAAGYNEVYLTESRHPDREDLDRAAPQHPVKLTHRSGHAHVLNSIGLARAEIHRGTDDPPQGIIDRHHETGDPTGVLWGLNEYLSRRIPPIDPAALSRGVSLANEKLLSHGITSFQDASARNDLERWKWYKALKAAGLLTSRATMMLGWRGFEQPREGQLTAHVRKHDLVQQGIKIVLDETTGSLFPDMERLKAMTMSIHRAGCQAAIHAIEPSAIKGAYDALSQALARYPRRNHRHRIEHCSVCPPEMAREIASLGVGVTTHPAFLYYSGDRYLRTVPADQQPYLYPIRSLIDAGIPVSAASDGPIVEVNPIPGIYAAVTRRTEAGEVVGSEEGVAPAQALAMYTVAPAAAAFQEETKGSLSVGKLADIVVLSANPLHIPPDEIRHIVVERTIIGGKTVWLRKGSSGVDAG